MRDRDDGAVERAHQLLRVLARLDVEVRLGLVEQQHIGVAEQARGESDELPLAAREDARRLREVVLVEPDLGEQRPRAARRSRGRRQRSSARSDPPAAAAAAPCRSRSAPASPSCVSTCASSRLELVEIGPRGAQRCERVALVAFELLRQEREHEAAALRQLARSAVSSPARMRSSVDLPPPFGPISPRRTPGSTSRSSPSRISREPKLFATPRTWSRDMPHRRPRRRSVVIREKTLG